MKNNQNVSFIYKIDEDGVRKRLKENELRINNAIRILKDFDEPHALTDLKMYIERGFSYLRDEAIKECKEYIHNSKMPSYLQRDSLQRAYESVNQNFLNEIENALIGIELPENLNVLKFSEEAGEYLFNDAYITAELEKKRYVLTDDEQTDFIKFKEVLRLLGEVERGTARFAAFDTLVDYRLRADSSDEVVASALKAYQRRK